MKKKKEKFELNKLVESYVGNKNQMRITVLASCEEDVYWAVSNLRNPRLMCVTTPEPIDDDQTVWSVLCDIEYKPKKNKYDRFALSDK